MSEITLGIIGGGQLGSMLAIAAKKLNVKTVVFCDDIDHLHKIFAINLLMEITIIKKRYQNL